MKLSRTAKFYRDNPEAREKHNESSKKWNKSEKGKKYKKKYNGKTKDETSSRNKARALMMKKGKVKKGDGKHIDHIDKNPKNNKSSNLRVLSAAKNVRRNKK